MKYKFTLIFSIIGFVLGSIRLFNVLYLIDAVYLNLLFFIVFGGIVIIYTIVIGSIGLIIDKFIFSKKYITGILLIIPLIFLAYFLIYSIPHYMIMNWVPENLN